MLNKKYIFFTNTIYDIGGAQLYIKKKLEYLKSNNWQVIIISGSEGNEILIDKFSQFSNYCFQELMYFPFLFSNKKQKEITKRILSIINDMNCHIIIESNTESMSLWGEIIASKLYCKNFTYILQESFSTFNKQLYNYFDFKHKRKELAGITSESLTKIFRNFKKLSKNQKYYLSAAGASSGIISEVDNQIINNLSKLDVNIGCISRLQKPFVMTMIDEIIVFANSNTEKQIQLILIGASPDGEKEKAIKGKISKINNIKLIMLGKLYPIPINIIKYVDIFIGVAGSARVTHENGALTLGIDVETHKPIGIMGVDTDIAVYSENYKYDSISQALDKIILEEKLYKEQCKSKKIKGDLNKEYEKHFEFINGSSNKKQYLIITFSNSGLRNILKGVLMRTLGINIYKKLLVRISKLRKNSLE